MTKRIPLFMGSLVLAAMAASAPACSSSNPGELISDGVGGDGQVTFPSGGKTGASEAGSTNDPSNDGSDGSDGSDSADGSDGSDGSGGTSNGDSGTSANGSTTSSTAGSSASAGTTSTTTDTACNNGIDDDGDGLIDGFDPECTGPLDNDEGTFATGIPGDNRDPKWQDCFFDGNSGAGDDGCRYHTDCLYGKKPADDRACAVSEQCINFCRPLTQNGCDCFGCCTVQLPSGDTVDIVESAACSLAKIGDTKACPRCQKNTACANECGECELCLGKTALPDSCKPPVTGGDGSSGSGSGGSGSGSGGSSSGGTSSPPGSGGAPNSPPPAYTCDGGEQVCGPDLPCEFDYQYCSLGCCITVIR